MATYKKIYDDSHENNFQNRVEVAIISAAIAISSENVSTANHENRVSLARDVLRSPSRWADLFSLGVALDANVQADKSVDSNLYNAVSSLWNAYAGVI